MRQFKPGQLQTGSLYNISSSYAVTASFALNGGGGGIDTGSFVTTASFNAFTASYTTGSFTGSFIGTLQGTSSWASNSLTASYVVTSQTASYVQLAQSASYALNAVSASYITASNVYGPFGSNSIISASYATTASLSLATTENRILVLNQSGQNIAKGVVVHITASNNSGDVPHIITASFENDNNSANTLGITSQLITNGTTGFVTTEGVVTGINTNAFDSGQLVYLGATGSIIGYAPIAPLHSVRLGQVIRHQSNNGSIYVRIDNGYELSELHDVLVTGSATGDLLVRSGSVWINSKQLSGSYSLTGSLTATSFTGSISGTSSFATTSSYALTASFAPNYVLTNSTSSMLLPYVLTSSTSSMTVLSSSFSSTASYLNTLNQDLTFNGNLTLNGTASISFLNVTYETASVIYSSGSNQFGDAVNDVQTLIGQTVISGSLQLTGSANLPSITGSVFGTSSWAANAITASYIQTSQTASYVLNAVSSSYTTNALSSSYALSASYAPSTPTFPFTGSALITGSLGVTGSVSITQNLTSSRVYISSSNGTVSGSTLTVYGSGSTQPVLTVLGSQGELFSITDSLSGSLFSVNDNSGLPILEVFSDNTTLIGNYLDPMLITTAKVVQTNSGSFTMYSLPTASYDTAFFEYSVKSGSNARAGTIMAIQSGSAVNFTETTTTDFGNTAAISFTVVVTGSNMALTGSSTSGAWTIKTIVRGL